MYYSQGHVHLIRYSVTNMQEIEEWMYRLILLSGCVFLFMYNLYAYNELGELQGRTT